MTRRMLRSICGLTIEMTTMNGCCRKQSWSARTFWVLGLMWLGAGSALAQNPVPVAGQVMVTTGSVKVIDAQGRERVLEKGGEVRSGDRILTGDNGLVQVRMQDGGYLSIRASTEMAIDGFVHDEKDQNNSRFLVNLIKGGFRSITGLIGRSNPNAYKVTAGTATIGIRGTDHEPMMVVPGPPNIPVINAPGVYDKVNSGETFIQNERGILSLKPGQIGFAPVRPDLPPQVVLKIPDFYRETPKAEGRDQKDATQRKENDKGGPARPVGNSLRPGFTEQTPSAVDAPTGAPRTAAGETAPRLTAPVGATGPLPASMPVERPLASPGLPPPPILQTPLMPPPIVMDRPLTTTVLPPPPPPPPPPPQLLPPPLLPPPPTTTIIR